MSNSKMDGFIREGITRYGEAHATITAFEEEIQRRLKEKFTSRPWRSFKLNLDKVRTSAGGDSDGPWLDVWTEVRVGNDDATFDAGVWWTSPEVFVYAGFVKGPDAVRRLPFKASGRLKPKTLSRGRVYVSTPLAATDDLGSVVDEVLEAADLATGQALGK